MKFMCEYETRMGSSHEETAANLDSLLKAFSNWHCRELVTAAHGVVVGDGPRGSAAPIRGCTERRLWGRSRLGERARGSG
jgi:hypothetical protein